jgi:hypothetical protein
MVDIIFYTGAYAVVIAVGVLGVSAAIKDKCAD